MENVWHSRLDIDTCIANLKRSVNNESIFAGDVSGNVGGKIKGHKFQLWKRQIQYHNSFGSIFYGNLVQERTGTRISGHFGLDSMVKVILYVMYGVVILIGGLIYIGTLTNWISGTQNQGHLSLFFYIVPFLALLILWGFSKIGTWFGKTEQKYIIEYLKNTLKAKETSL
jgi:hypothetical protein